MFKTVLTFLRRAPDEAAVLRDENIKLGSAPLHPAPKRFQQRERKQKPNRAARRAT